jgi:hypothetical protein
MARQGFYDCDDEREEPAAPRFERSSGKLVAERLQDEMRAAVQSIRSAPWAPVPPESTE